VRVGKQKWVVCQHNIEPLADGKKILYIYLYKRERERERERERARERERERERIHLWWAETF